MFKALIFQLNWFFKRLKIWMRRRWYTNTTQSVMILFFDSWTTPPGKKLFQVSLNFLSEEAEDEKVCKARQSVSNSLEQKREVKVKKLFQKRLVKVLPVTCCMLLIACCGLHVTMYVAHCMSCVAYCMLPVECCLLHTACFLLHVTRCMLLVACYLLYVARYIQLACCMWHVAWLLVACWVVCVLHVVCYFLHVGYCLLYAVCCMLLTACCMLYVTFCMLHVACCLLHVAHQAWNTTTDTITSK